MDSNEVPQKKAPSLRKLKLRASEAENDYFFTLSQKLKEKIERQKLTMQVDEIERMISRSHHQQLHQTVNQMRAEIDKLDLQSLNLLINLPMNVIFPSKEVEQTFHDAVKASNVSEAIRLLVEASNGFLSIGKQLAKDYYSHQYQKCDGCPASPVTDLSVFKRQDGKFRCGSCHDKQTKQLTQ